jgi:hypothetical protein
MMHIQQNKLSVIQYATLAVAFCLWHAASAQALLVEVEITNNAPSNGVAITPVWAGFHDGSFDSYNGGLSSQEGLERLAEDGNTSVISADFLGGYTYIDAGTSSKVLSSQAGADRVDGTIASAGPPPLTPGESTSQQFTIDIDGSNRYFSYASMVLPSNDYYIANGNPTAHDLMSLYDGSGSITFNVGLAGAVNDAGTEVNDFNTSAGNGLFPGRGLPAGQGGPNVGADENGVNTNVASPFSGFLNSAGVDLTGFDFNDTGLYPNGIATITITAVPEPSTLLLAGLGLAGILSFVRKKG